MPNIYINRFKLGDERPKYIFVYKITKNLYLEKNCTWFMREGRAQRHGFTQGVNSHVASELSPRHESDSHSYAPSSHTHTPVVLAVRYTVQLGYKPVFFFWQPGLGYTSERRFLSVEKHKRGKKIKK